MEKQLLHMEHNNNQFDISAVMLQEKFELSDCSYEISNFQINFHQII